MARTSPDRRIDRRLAMLLVVPVVAAIAAGATFAFSSSSSVSAAGGANRVEIQNFSFHPPTITVKPGTKVSVNMSRAQPDRAAFAISTRPMSGVQVTS